jgi:ABC-type antimicrobial peptide transport system permease subunit
MLFFKVVLLSFSSLAVLTSFFLFFIVMYITIEENRKEIILLDYLGIPKKQIRTSFIVCGIIFSSMSFFLFSYRNRYRRLCHHPRHRRLCRNKHPLHL